VEKANSGIGSMPIRPNEQLAKRREGSGRHDIGFYRWRLFNPADDNPRRLLERHASSGFPQEGSLAGIDLYQGHVEVGSQGRQHQAGKSATAAQIGQRRGFGWDQGCKLRRIQDMPGPDILDRCPANEVDGFLPAQQGADQGFELIACFT